MPDIGLRSADSKTRLATYLNDHLGGSTTGRELARRIVASNRGNEYGIVMEQVAREIEEDARALQDLMARLDIQPDRIKEAMGWTMEKLGRLKLNGQLLGYSPLSRLVELEGLMMGITGKLALWHVLRPVLAEDPRLEGFDFERMIGRAQEQRRTVERLRRRAGIEALS
jgi:hypothetical protein